MALEYILKSYIDKGEPSDIIDKLKQNDVCLESFFDQVQIHKAQHNSKIFFQELYRITGDGGFGPDGIVQSNVTGYRMKIIYTYFNAEGNQQTDFILL